MISDLKGSLCGAAVGANGVRYCPATTCIDLSQYSFMKNNACICNSPILVTLATEAGDARLHFLRALIGEHLAPLNIFCSMGCSSHFDLLCGM
jgi:hypothetical protein